MNTSATLLGVVITDCDDGVYFGQYFWRYAGFRRARFLDCFHVLKLGGDVERDPGQESSNALALNAVLGSECVKHHPAF